MKRLLIVGAGASIEECKRSGNYRDDSTKYFPAMNNFGEKLFQRDSSTLLTATSSYLNAHNIKFDSKLLTLKEGEGFTGEDMKQSPIGVFLRLEKQLSKRHNIERLSEFTWQKWSNNPEFWDSFIHDAIYLNLFALFSEQFGLGFGVPMNAGRKVAFLLESGDKVINLNYDLVFDLALKQAGKDICYAPDYRANAISIVKPHGSMNFYVNIKNGNCYFEEPNQIRGSVGFPDAKGGYFFPHSGFVPPRLNKDYKQHPSAEIILNTDRPFRPSIVTFWGVGLTPSDKDLLAIYSEACEHVKRIEYINPSKDDWKKAKALLRRDSVRYPTLDSWFQANGIV